MNGPETRQDSGVKPNTTVASAAKQGNLEIPHTFTEEEVKPKELKAVNDYVSRTSRREEELTKREQEIKDWEARWQKEDAGQAERE
jgi:hypothetical protein